jgi:hypothetical protein
LRSGKDVVIDRNLVTGFSVSILSYRIKLPSDKFNAGLHDVFHVMNIRKYDPNKADPDFNTSSKLPEVESIEMQYEIDEILQHSVEGGFNKFLQGAIRPATGAPSLANAKTAASRGHPGARIYVSKLLLLHVLRARFSLYSLWAG